MRKEFTYKLQGDGRDSWEVREFDENDQMIAGYMVFEDPTVKPISSVDIAGLLNNLTTEEKQELATILTQILNQ